MAHPLWWFCAERVKWRWGEGSAVWFIQNKFELSQFLGFSINIYGIEGDFFFWHASPCSGSFRCPLRHLERIAACLTPTLQSLPWQRGSRGLWLARVGSQPAGPGALTWARFLLNAPEPAAQLRSGTVLLPCCRHHTALVTRGGRNRNSRISSHVYRCSTSFSLLEKASLISGL